MQEGKYPEFKMPDIYPAFFNPAKCCLPNSISGTIKLSQNTLWQMSFPQYEGPGNMSLQNVRYNVRYYQIIAATQKYEE